MADSMKGNEQLAYERGLRDGAEQAAAELRRCREAHVARSRALRPDAASAHVLRSHYLAEVICDHENKMDKPRCACSLVDLGWHPSVGQAVDAWIAHVVAVNAERLPVPEGEPAREPTHAMINRGADALRTAFDCDPELVSPYRLAEAVLRAALGVPEGT